MGRYSLFVLEVPLNANQPTNQPTDLVLQYGVSLQQYACSVNDAVSALSTLESCLAFLHSWFRHSGLALNPSKSEAIIFGTRQRFNSFPIPSVIHILSSSMPISDYITMLVVTLQDSNLTLN